MVTQDAVDWSPPEWERVPVGGKGVEISDQVVGQFYLGCEMNVGACDGDGGEVVKFGVYRVCYGVKKHVGGPLEVYRVEWNAIRDRLIETKVVV